MKNESRVFLASTSRSASKGFTNTYNISVPYWLIIHRKTKKDKKVILNFNQYHKWYPTTRNDYKQFYTEQVGPIITKLPKMSHIDLIEYKVFYEKNGKYPDTRNITNLVDKFFCDALVHYEIVKDDDHFTISGTKDTWGGVDKDNPRIEITILAEISQ